MVALGVIAKILRGKTLAAYWLNGNAPPLSCRQNMIAALGFWTASSTGWFPPMSGLLEP
jgi:hypothetical protein